MDSIDFGNFVLKESMYIYKRKSELENYLIEKGFEKDKRGNYIKSAGIKTRRYRIGTRRVCVDYWNSSIKSWVSNYKANLDDVCIGYDKKLSGFIKIKEVPLKF